jgi:hypothetical protein
MSVAAKAQSQSRQSAPNHASGVPYRPRGFNRRSRQRFERDRTAQLARHLGRDPSYPERLIISRICSIEYWLRRLDAAIDAGEELSGHAIRGRLAAENRLRLDLQALGLAPAAPRPPSFREYWNRPSDPGEAVA